RAKSAVCWLALLLALGCRTIATHVPEKSVEDLYFEAVSQVHPETTLGLANGGNSPAVEGKILQPAAAGIIKNSKYGPVPPPTYQPPVTLDAVRERRQGSVKPGTEIELDRGLILQVAAEESPSEKLVSDFFEETEIHEAIQSLATQAGVSVVLDEQVGGLVTAVIEDEPFERALKKVCLPLALITHQREDGTWLVGVNEPDSALFPLIAQRTEYRPLHLSTEELISTIPDRLKPYMQAVEKRNLILIEAPEELVDVITQQLTSADQPIPQVVLEAIICVVAPESNFRFGLDWGHAVQMDGKTLLDFSSNGLALNGVITPTGLGNPFSDFAVTSAFVKLLAQEGYLTIRAAPRVMAKDGEQATISITRETFFSVQPQNSQFLFRQDIQKVDAGISLTITPVIRGDSIQVNIEKAEVSEDIRSNIVNAELTANPYPLINRRNVTTTVNIKDGQSIVIGGLVQRQTVDRVSQVPGLGRIPKLGAVFRTVEKQEQDAEVVIFISPRIVTPAALPSP
ncbi:MAG: type II and III secretion system protein, partial [Planctomycetaceae bacterium]|nr:type II and III secretion system protein [Planctomycetaceae bacterium]